MEFFHTLQTQVPGEVRDGRVFQRDVLVRTFVVGRIFVDRRQRENRQIRIQLRVGIGRIRGRARVRRPGRVGECRRLVRLSGRPFTTDALRRAQERDATTLDLGPYRPGREIRVVAALSEAAEELVQNVLVQTAGHQKGHAVRFFALEKLQHPVDRLREPLEARRLRYFPVLYQVQVLEVPRRFRQIMFDNARVGQGAAERVVAVQRLAVQTVEHVADEFDEIGRVQRSVAPQFSRFYAISDGGRHGMAQQLRVQFDADFLKGVRVDVGVRDFDRRLALVVDFAQFVGFFNVFERDNLAVFPVTRPDQIVPDALLEAWHVDE